MGCDLKHPPRKVALSISIHAPAWGATVGGLGCTVRILISIHAPAWGATQRAAIMAQVLKQFQSTHPRGVRLGCKVDDIFYKSISIHAPAWGATGKDKVVQKVSQFQSTHPRGVRPPTCTMLVGDRDFNPRTRVGCDLNSLYLASSSRFQSTHPRGVRLYHKMEQKCCKRFQSTHPRGVRRYNAGAVRFTPAISIHAPAWGATSMSSCSKAAISISIHAPAWGATATLERCPLRGVHFNPRTRVGCDVVTWLLSKLV